jgi:hypothetical protein
MHKYLKSTFLEIPAFLLMLLACYLILYNVGMFIEYFTYPHLGKWGFLLTLPITWPYIYSPILDKIWDFFDRNFL